MTGGPPAKARFQRVTTLVLVLSPALALAAVAPFLWGRAFDVTDLVTGGALYVLTGFGVSVGYHRLFTHRSFKASRWLKVALALAGSMAVEGSVTSWVANHRRHHLHSDRSGDPHSPHRYGPGTFALVKGLAFAHVGWLFASDDPDVSRYAPDVLRDRDIQRVDRLFPVLAGASLAVPFAAVHALSGSPTAAVSALVWAGVVRMALLHHVTWSVNSLCHTFGRRTTDTADQSTNLWALAPLSFGESWHNVHHAHPGWARHGAGPRMVDPSARLIAIFESFGWVSAVRWPRAAACAT